PESGETFGVLQADGPARFEKACNKQDQPGHGCRHRILRQGPSPCMFALAVPKRQGRPCCWKARHFTIATLEGSNTLKQRKRMDRLLTRYTAFYLAILGTLVFLAMGMAANAWWLLAAALF